MCVCVCVCVRERERDPNIKVIQYVCRLSNLKQSISVYTRYPETKTVNQCVCRLSKYKRVSWVYRLSRYKTISMCVCGGGGLHQICSIPLHPPRSIWRFKSSGMLLPVDWKTMRFRRPY